MVAFPFVGGVRVTSIFITVLLPAADSASSLSRKVRMLPLKVTFC